jgi:hypothetical protein
MPDSSELIYVLKICNRDCGSVVGSDDYLDIKLSKRASNGTGFDRHQTLSAGEISCSENSVGLAALRLKLVPYDETAIDAEFNLHFGDGANTVQAQFDAHIPDLPPDLVRMLISTLSGCYQADVIVVPPNAERLFT